MRPNPYQNPSTRRPLTDQQIFRASTLWEENHSLGDTAQEVGCGVYQLGFLYRELLPSLRRIDVTPIVKGREPTSVKYEPRPKTHQRSMYAIGFRDNETNVIRDGYEAGPFVALKDALAEIPDEGNIIVRLIDPPTDLPEIVAEWDSEHSCWVVTGKKTKRA